MKLVECLEHAVNKHTDIQGFYEIPKHYLLNNQFEKCNQIKLSLTVLVIHNLSNFSLTFLYLSSLLIFVGSFW